MKCLFLLPLILLAGCSYSSFYVPSERLVYPPMSPKSVAISTQKSLRLPHKIIGRVAAITPGGGDSVRERIQEEAARIGANLVIDYKMESSFTKTAASGLAVLVFQEK